MQKTWKLTTYDDDGNVVSNDQTLSSDEAVSALELIARGERPERAIAATANKPLARVDIDSRRDSRVPQLNAA